MTTLRPEEWARANPWLMKPPTMGPTQVHPQAPPARASAEVDKRAPPPRASAKPDNPARSRPTLSLRALMDPGAQPEDLVDTTELNEVELPEVDWWSGRDPDAPQRDAPVRRRPDAHRSFHDVAHQSPPPERLQSGQDRRKAPRYSLTSPAVIEIRNWSELVTLYVRDISSGGMFVGTTAPPARGVEVTVQLLLPDETGTLDFDGRVVRVVTADQATATGQVPGFGIEFLGLTPVRRQALERLIEQAKQTTAGGDAERPQLSTLGLSGNPGPAGGLRLTLSESERQQMQQLRAELEAMSERGDLELLGLSEPGTSEQVRVAFERLAKRWHPDATHRDAPPEVRALATEIFLRIESAYRRLFAKPVADSSRAVGSEPGPAGAPPSPPAHDAGARPNKARGTDPSSSSRSRRPARRGERPSQSTRTNARRARKMVDELLERGDDLTHRLKRRGQRALSEEERDELVDGALDMISAKRYREAGRQLMKVIRDRPELRLRVLLSVVNARQAVTDRDFARARNCYQAVLQLDPNNALARRELALLAGFEDR